MNRFSNEYLTLENDISLKPSNSNPHYKYDFFLINVQLKNNNKKQGLLLLVSMSPDHV